MNAYGQVVLGDHVWSRENGVEFEYSFNGVRDISGDGSKILAGNEIYTNGELSFTLPPHPTWGIWAGNISDDGKTVMYGGGGIDAYTLWTEDQGFQSILPGYFTDLSPNGRYLIGNYEVVDLEGGTSHTIPGNPDLDAVTSAGIVVGRRDYSDLVSGNKEATLWDGAETIRLGSLKGQGYGSRAVDISDNGNIVIGHSFTNEDSTIRGDAYEAFIWDSINGMRSLEDMLQNDLGVDLNGWKLTNATAISEDGYHIVGKGLDASGNIGFWMVTLIDECTASAW